MTGRIRLLAVCVLFASVFMAPQAAHAAVCTNATLAGGWGYLLQDNFTFPPPNPPLTFPVFAQSGLITFDGAGHFTLLDTRTAMVVLIDAADVIRDEQSQGTYVINADCTGTLIVHQAPATLNLLPGFLFNVTHINFTLTPPGNTVATLTVTDPELQGIISPVYAGLMIQQ